VADPYASRLRPPPLSGADGEPEWLGEIDERGGLLVRSAVELPDLGAVEAASFVAVACFDLGVVPPLARLGAPLAAAFLIARSDRVDAAAANRSLGILATAEPLFLLKQGVVAGPEGRGGARVVDAELIGAALDAALAGTLQWETDPNLGYETPVAAPGLSGADLDALSPRFLYARNDRVYGHAALIPELQQVLHAAVAAIPGIDPAIVAATGWPPDATGSSWKED